MAHISEPIPFEARGLEEIDFKLYPSSWPIVYLLFDEKNLYVGETTGVKKRLSQHLVSKNPQIRSLKSIILISHEKFNKSAILDLEATLLKFLPSDRSFNLLNSNLIGNQHDYYDKRSYESIFSFVWEKLMEIKFLKSDYKTLSNSAIFKYSPYKILTDDQELITRKIVSSLRKNKSKKNIYLVRGGAGTGKTVLISYLMKLFKTEFYEDSLDSFESDQQDLINDLKEINFNDKKIALVVPRAALRATLKKVFSNIHGLKSSMVIGPHDLKGSSGKYDLLLVDEAHRLCSRINSMAPARFDEVSFGLGLKQDATQLDWVLTQAKTCILFFDKNQSIGPADVKSSQFEKLKAVETFELRKQIRVLGGEYYIEFVNKLLSVSTTKETRPLIEKFKTHYEVKFFRNASLLKNEINAKAMQKQYSLSRVIAGYSWEYRSKNGKSTFDFELDGNKFKWNDSSVQDWVNSENALKEVGCIHNVQGYDLNYAGVIFGPEITYDPIEKKIKIIKSHYHDSSGKRTIKDEAELHAYILNIYSVLLTRGINGTYIYACDPGLADYFSEHLVDG